MIVVLIVAGVGALALSGTRATQAVRDVQAAQPNHQAEETKASQQAAQVVVPAKQEVSTDTITPESASSATSSTTAPVVIQPSITPPTPPVAATTTTPATPQIAGTRAATPTPGKHNPGNVKITAPPASSTSPAAKAEPPADPAAIMPDGVPTKLGEYDIRPVKIETKDDGSLLLDNRFTLRGKGTREDPYRVSWELLVSAKDTFEPAAGLKKIPGRVAMLHDKFVRLDGYVAFPLMMQKPTELLSMLNQWDGCCIGVPPTPYDAVEVKLIKMVTGDARFAMTGGVVGKFKVDPYVVKNPKGDWLIGMYTMSIADFTPEDIGDGAGT